MNKFQELMMSQYVKELATKEKINGADFTENTLENVLNNMQFLRENVTAFGEESAYLPLPVKKMLAYLLSPTNRVEYTINKGEDWAEAEARFYESDTATVPTGVGFAKVFVTQVYKNDFVDQVTRLSKLEATARGMAASRAYTDAGIGLQFYGDTIDTDKDEAKEKAEKKTAEARAEMKNAEMPAPAKPETKSVTTDNGMTLPLPPSQKERQAAKRAAKKASSETPAPQTASVDTETRSEEIVAITANITKNETPAPAKTMTAKEAMTYTADAGTLTKGMLLGDIMTSDDVNLRRSLVYLYKNKPEGRTDELDTALITLINLDPELKELLKK